MAATNKWVVGFLFRNEKEVALISKNRPAWLQGKLTGVGGKVEKGESAQSAVHREFLEEAGVAIEDWRKFALLRVQDGELHYFVAHGDHSVRSMTDEEVAWYTIKSLENLPILRNLTWLIPLALDAGNRNTVTEYFESLE